MKKYIIVSLLIMFIIPSIALASRCEQIGSTTFCDDGSRYEQIGNTIFGNDGSRYEQNGNTIFGNDGSKYEQIGNTTFVNDGSRYEQIGNNIFGNDGSRYEQIGNTNFSSGGTNSCPANSSYDYLSSKCKCKTGYVISGSKCIYDYSYTAPVNKPTETIYETCQDTYGINSYSSSSGKCGCITGYEWATDKKSCIKNNVTAINSNTAPTCSITITPQTVEVNKDFKVLYLTTGQITSASIKGTGDSNYFVGNIWSKDTGMVKGFNSGYFPQVQRANTVGSSSLTLTVTGVGGSSTCTESYAVVSKPISGDSNITLSPTDKNINIKKEDSNILQENKFEIIKTIPEPQKKLKWYQKIFNWFK